jgi:hypothetical protein
MLLDPAKQQLNLPAALVERGDLDGAAVNVVGEQSDEAALLATKADAAQRHRQSRIALADEPDFVIGDDRKASVPALAQRATFDGAQPHAPLRPGDKESLAIVDLLPPVEATISLVEHVADAGCNLRLPANLDVVDDGRRDRNGSRHISQGIVDDVQFHAANAAIPFRPATRLTQRDRAGVDQAHHGAAFLPGPPVRRGCQHREGLGKDGGRPPRIGVRQRRTRELAGAQMIVMLAVGIEAGLQRAKALKLAQLRIHQGHQMIPALERLVVSVAVLPIHKLGKLPTINRFKQSGKNAIGKSHARPLLCLDNQQGPICIGTAEHAPRHSESFPGQPCRGERVARPKAEPGEGG